MLCKQYLEVCLKGAKALDGSDWHLHAPQEVHFPGHHHQPFEHQVAFRSLTTPCQAAVHGSVIFNLHVEEASMNNGLFSLVKHWKCWRGTQAGMW